MTEITVGITVRRTLDQFTLGVGVNSTAGSEGLALGSVEHTSELNFDVILLDLLSDTEETSLDNTLVNLGNVLRTIASDFAVFNQVEIAHARFADIVPSSVRVSVTTSSSDNELGGGDDDVLGLGDTTHDEDETLDSVVFVEDGERSRTQNTEVDLVVVENGTTVLNGSVGAEVDFVLFSIVVDDDGVNGSIAGFREDHDNIITAEVVQIEVVVREGEAERLP